MAIDVKNLVKSFHDGDRVTRVLKGITLSIDDGSFVAIIGRSGAGKSTFMYQMSLLDEPSEGDVIVEGRSTNEMTNAEETKFRLEKFGYVFQDYALVPELTAVENVALPLLMQGLPRERALADARAALTRVNLEAHLAQLPSQLSGGEQQRVSIARAIAHLPKVLFADEPTANLDRESSDGVMHIFGELHDAGQTIIMVTHELEYAHAAERIIRLDDGVVVSDERVPATERKRYPHPGLQAA